MTLEVMFSCKDLPPSDRFDGWYEMTNNTYIPGFLSTRHRSDFHGEVGAIGLGSALILAAAHSPISCCRTPKLIRKSDPELYVLGRIRRGSATFSQAGRDIAVGVDDFVLYDTSRPFGTETDAADGRCAEITVHFPKTAFALPPRTVDQLISRRLPIGQGVRGLLGVTLGHLVSGQCRLGPADAPRVGGIVLDLIASAVAEELDAGSLLPPETHRTALAMRIRAFVEQHLGDPRLSPTMIAEAHHVSLRHVQRIFRQDGQTVAGWIRHRRLERSRRDLESPLLRTRPVHAIAAHWGFASPQHFSRAFRKAYGVSPQEYRRCASGP